MVEVDTVEDVHRAKRESKIAVAYDLEGMDALNGDVGMVDVYYKLGVRQMLFAYNRNNLAGSGCHDEDIGLTPFGRDVIREMNRLGMVVDCSHTGYRTSMEAMEESAAPVIFSHSNARRLCDHERNIHDDQILALRGDRRRRRRNRRGPASSGPEGATVEHLVEHIDHMVTLVGPEHVGIGLDSRARGRGASVSRPFLTTGTTGPRASTPSREPLELEATSHPKRSLRSPRSCSSAATTTGTCAPSWERTSCGSQARCGNGREQHVARKQRCRGHV